MKKQQKVKDSASNGLKKELSFANPLMKEDQLLINKHEQETEMVAIKVEVSIASAFVLDKLLHR